jgi:hypothetical protein
VHPTDPDGDVLTFVRLDPEAAGRVAGTWHRATGVLAPEPTTRRSRPLQADGATVMLESRTHGLDLVVVRTWRRPVAVPLVDLRRGAAQPSAVLRPLADDLERLRTHGGAEVVEVLREQARFLDYDDQGVAASPLGIRSGSPRRGCGDVLSIFDWF